jgi:hypothetical protein
MHLRGIICSVLLVTVLVAISELAFTLTPFALTFDLFTDSNASAILLFCLGFSLMFWLLLEEFSRILCSMPQTEWSNRKFAPKCCSANHLMEPAHLYFLYNYSDLTTMMCRTGMGWGAPEELPTWVQVFGPSRTFCQMRIYTLIDWLSYLTWIIGGIILYSL